MSCVSHYVVVRYGDLFREEHLNVAVFAWDRDGGPDTPVIMHVLSDWSRVHATFPRDSQQIWQDNVTERLRLIKTRADYEHARSRIGPYTPFSFSEERPGLCTAERLVIEMADAFLSRKPI